MSFDLGAAIRAEWAKPETQKSLAALEIDAIKAVELLEKVVLKAAEAAIEGVFPVGLRQLFSAVAGPLMDAGITKAESATDEALKGLLPIQTTASIGSQKLALTVSKVFSSDLPQNPFESLPDDPTTRNQ